MFLLFHTNAEMHPLPITLARVHRSCHLASNQRGPNADMACTTTPLTASILVRTQQPARVRRPAASATHYLTRRANTGFIIHRRSCSKSASSRTMLLHCTQLKCRYPICPLCQSQTQIPVGMEPMKIVQSVVLLYDRSFPKMRCMMWSARSEISGHDALYHGVDSSRKKSTMSVRHVEGWKSRQLLGIEVQYRSR